MVIDPACGMEVNPDNPGATATYDGDVYVFCSEGCREHFEADPEQYLDDYEHGVQLSRIGDVLTQRVPTVEGVGSFELSVAEPGKLSVGDEVTYRRTITDEHVEQFAEITGDANALHLSDSFARRTRFGGRIVHGALVSGLISAALAALPGMTVFLSQNLEFKRPVEIGDTVEATCRVVEEVEDDRFCLTVKATTGNDGPAIHGTAMVLIDDLAELT
ncbi:MaoC/PaaZ C-terminal domain-containing protein (plasmid) [Halorientalis pallida]|uniref:MaoC/PaaZ C-terminal domain-containing protein n=1 Tax=Halorientalis pallida TaxID=2479928 RepID=UPI003C6F861B